jgi:hypothetical protein
MQNKGEKLSEYTRKTNSPRDVRWAQQWIKEFHETDFPGRPLTTQYHQIKELAETPIKVKKD